MTCVGRGGDVGGVGRGVQQYARRKGSVVVGCQVIPVSETSRQLHIRPASEVRQYFASFVLLTNLVKCFVTLTRLIW